MSSPKARTNKDLSPWVFTVFATVFLAQTLPGLWSNSLTNDEPVEITNGYFALTKGDVAGPHHYGPVATAWNALPLLGMGLQTSPGPGDVLDRAHSFIFQWNRDRLLSVTVAARLPGLLLALALGWLLYRVTRGEKFLSATTLFFWAFHPGLLAYAPLAKSDMPACFLFFSTVLLFMTCRSGAKPGTCLAAGLVAGLAVGSKLSCLVLLPVLLLLEWLRGRERGKPKEVFRRWAWGSLGSISVLTFVFILWPGMATLEGTSWPSSNFFEKVHHLSQMNQSHFPVYFLGHSGFQNHWVYYPVVLFLKDPTTFLVFLLWGVGAALLGKVKIPAWTWVPPLVLLGTLLPVLNEGVRFLLPVFPFAFLIAAKGAEHLWKAGRDSLWTKERILVILLLAGQGIGTILNFPGYISYFNEFVPSVRKLGLLADSNLDWGQDHRRLAQEAGSRHWGRVKMAYLGGVDPSVYGTSWEPWRQSDLKGPRSGTTYLVNLSFFQLAPIFYPETMPIASGWIADTPPTGKIGDSWVYFEVPGKQPPLDPSDPILPSVPFQQKRGYTPYPPAPVGPHPD